MDIEGYIVEKLSGQSLPDFMRDHIFKPLGMKDAGFFVPAGKAQPLRNPLRTGPQGRTGCRHQPRQRPRDYYASPPCLRAAAAWFPPPRTTIALPRCWPTAANSTASASWRRPPCKLMTSNHVPAELLTGSTASASRSCGPASATATTARWSSIRRRPTCPDGKGTFFWDGAAGTWFWVDPTNDVVFVGMIQRMRGPAIPTSNT